MSDLAQRDRDFVRKPLSFVYLWGIPIVILFSVNVVQHYWPATIVLLMMISSYAWMGAGCILNAARCGRLHCYFTGPIFLTGAFLIALVGFEIATLGSLKVPHISYITIGLALSTFALEWVWGAYRKQS